MRKPSLVPALIVALLLHVGVGLLFWFVRTPPPPPDPMGAAVPVTIVSDAPSQAPTVSPELNPVDTAPPAADKAEDKPDTPPPPTPAKPQPPVKPPTPAPAKPQKKVTPTKPTPKTSVTSDWNPLQAATDAAKNAKAPKKAAKPGPLGGGLVAGPTAAQAGVALKGMVQKVERFWNVDCGSAADRGTDVSVHFTVSSTGQVTGVSIVNSNAPFLAASKAAPRAIKGAEPYSLDEVPAAYRNQPITMVFHAKDACRNR